MEANPAQDRSQKTNSERMAAVEAQLDPASIA